MAEKVGMNLEDIEAFRVLDKHKVADHIFETPQQLEDAWSLGMDLPLPDLQGVSSILITAVGESAAGADLLSAYAAPYCPLPLVVHRSYDLPAWTRGPQALVIAISHSGNTEETLSAYQQALSGGCRTLVVCAGGRLEQLARDAHQPVWEYPPVGQPRAAVVGTFGLLLAAFYRLGLLPDPSRELREALHAMRNQQTNLLPEVPVAYNAAKRLAGQLMGRWVVVLAADHLEPVARYWKCQIDEVAKAWGQFEFLPEADHNSLAGLTNPEAALAHTVALFLEAPSNHPRNLLRLGLTRQVFMEQGVGTDSIRARGETRLAHLLTLLHFGDYAVYYLAMAYGEDPSPVGIIEAMEDELGKTH